MKLILTEPIPIKMWLDDIEIGAEAQARNLAKLPFAFKHIAIMPDAHQGYGMPIGGVMATRGVIVPNAVGVDIGCGMIACKTNLASIDTDSLKKIMGKIREVIPVGFKHQKKGQNCMPMPEDSSAVPIVSREFVSAEKQIGTLGGGNHFIEIQKDTNGGIWVMIHSGSRNLGKQVADHYNKVAIQLNEKWRAIVPKEHQLAFLPIDSEEGHAYFNEMKYCVDFALANRKLMMDRVVECFGSNASGFRVEEPINIAHNYAVFENHFGENVIVHRKGATLAREGTVGIIPGSQGTKSYIVKGKGNKESFESCSHGAGRKMGRNDAKRRLNLADEIKRMDDQGIVHGIRNTGDLDEAPGSYKDITAVMANQQDLVEIVVELTPIGVIKG